jgi:hypothetical protein
MSYWPALAGDIHRFAIGAGYGPQWTRNTIQQNNALIDVCLFLKEVDIPRLGNSALLLGLGYTYLWTDADVNRDNHVISFLPAYRYYFSGSKKFQIFIHLAAGPSFMSSKQLGEQEQGSSFIFNDFIGVGVRWGRHREWELMCAWRHLSNADLFKPNNGFDVPLSLSLGYVF